jgi:hypothetical protein
MEDEIVAGVGDDVIVTDGNQKVIRKINKIDTLLCFYE